MKHAKLGGGGTVTHSSVGIGLIIRVSRFCWGWIRIGKKPNATFPDVVKGEKPVNILVIKVGTFFNRYSTKVLVSSVNYLEGLLSLIKKVCT